MKIHVENILSPYYSVINKKTGEVIHYCIWANDKKNIYKCYKINDKGEIVYNRDKAVITEKSKKTIKIVRKHSYIYMFFDSMKRVYKQLRVLKRFEKAKNKTLKNIEKGENHGRISKIRESK